MKVVPSFKLTQEGSDIIVNAAIEKAKRVIAVGTTVARALEPRGYSHDMF